MTEKKKPVDEQPADLTLSPDEAAQVKGGLGRPKYFAANDDCKETMDTGVMGCPG